MYLLTPGGRGQGRQGQQTQQRSTHTPVEPIAARQPLRTRASAGLAPLVTPALVPALTSPPFAFLFSPVEDLIHHDCKTEHVNLCGVHKAGCGSGVYEFQVQERFPQLTAASSLSVKLYSYPPTHLIHALVPLPQPLTSAFPFPTRCPALAPRTLFPNSCLPWRPASRTLIVPPPISLAPRSPTDEDHAPTPLHTFSVYCSPLNISGLMYISVPVLHQKTAEDPDRFTWHKNSIGKSHCALLMAMADVQRTDAKHASGISPSRQLLRHTLQTAAEARASTGAASDYPQCWKDCCDATVWKYVCIGIGIYIYIAFYH